MSFSGPSPPTATQMARFARMRNLEVWYTRFEIEKLLPQLRAQVGGTMRKRLDKAVAKALSRDNVQAFSKLSQTSAGSGGSSPIHR